MENQNKDDLEKNHFEDIVNLKKSGGITIPKNIRDELFPGSIENIFFKMVVPKEKDKIILEILPEEEAKKLSEELKLKRKAIQTTSSKVKKGKVGEKKPKISGPQPDFNRYFVYEFEGQQKIRPILESAFYKFTETPINFEDVMGRIKYALVSYLGSSNSENAKLYFSIINFLCDIIEQFNVPNLIEWISDKIIDNIKSKFLYEQSLLSLIETSNNMKRYEKSELFVKKILENIDNYAKSELYNIMNSFDNLVKVVYKDRSYEQIFELIKEKLLIYLNEIEDIDYKIQIIEILEKLQFIEIAYNIAKETLMSLPPESHRVEILREIVKRLHKTPV